MKKNLFIVPALAVLLCGCRTSKGQIGQRRPEAIVNIPPLIFVSPTPIDPETGLPFASPAVVFPAKGRVTKFHNQWKQRVVEFAVGNPNSDSEKRRLNINFFDADGHVIDGNSEYDLFIPAATTNYYIADEFLKPSAAAKVKTIKVKLE